MAKIKFSVNLAKLRENGVERLLEVILLDLLVEVVDVDCVVGPVLHHLGSWYFGFYLKIYSLNFVYHSQTSKEKKCEKNN